MNRRKVVKPVELSRRWVKGYEKIIALRRMLIRMLLRKIKCCSYRKGK